LVQDPPPRVRSAETAGSYLLSADRQVLLEAAPTGTSVRSTMAATGVLLGVFVPEIPPSPNRLGRVFVDPDGRPALLSWDPEAGVSGWDIASGKLTVRIADAVGGRRVLVDEAGWRLAVAGEGRAAAGRYRRSAITVWDLRTGGQLDKATDGSWEQRHPQFRPHSAADSLRTVAESGGLRAMTGADGLLLLDAASGTELFRAAPPDGTQGRVAFDGEGRHLLLVWEREGWSRVDVYEI
jgi:molecular chaperone DnaK